MRLLLLLSALLSALTGAGGMTRGVQAQAVVTQEAPRGVAVPVVVRAATALRPPAALASLRDVSLTPPVGATANVASVPLYASRRRE